MIVCVSENYDAKSFSNNLFTIYLSDEPLRDVLPSKMKAINGKEISMQYKNELNSNAFFKEYE